MNKEWSGVLNYVVARASEPSTWASISAALGATGATAAHNGSTEQWIAIAGSILSALAGAAMKEKK
jgi:hypothetical protein